MNKNSKIIVVVNSKSELHKFCAMPMADASEKKIFKTYKTQLEDANATKKETALFESTVNASIELLQKNEVSSEIIEVDLNESGEDSAYSLFSLKVHSCKGNSEVKKGDKIALIFPPLCLEDFGVVCKSPDWIVAVKLDETFTAQRACDIFLDNCKYKRYKLDKKSSLENLESVAWDKLDSNDIVFPGYLEIAKVTLV